MRLKDYLKREKISAAHFARQLLCHPQTIYSITSEKNFPSYSLAKAIEDYTEGEVTAEELLAKKNLPPRCPTCGRVCWKKIPISKKPVAKK